MGVQCRGHGFRARLKKGERTFNGPVRDTEAEAAADERQYQQAAAESVENVETLHEELQRPPDFISQRGNTWRAKVVQDGRPYFGPYRNIKSAAEADAKQFMEAGCVSADAVACVSQELRETELGERQCENFDSVMQSHMQTLLLPQGCASSGLSKTLQNLQRTKQEDYSVALDACKLLVTDYEANENLVQRGECGLATGPGVAVSIGLWQSAIGNQRFRRTPSTLWLAQSGQQFLVEFCRAVLVSLSTIAKRFVRSYR